MARFRLAAGIAALFVVFVAPARADFGWSQPDRLAFSAPIGYTAIGIDAKGVATIAWTSQAGVYAATRKPGGPLGKPQQVSPIIGAVHMAVAENGDAVLAWADGRNGTTYASVRPAGGQFGPAQVLYDPLLDAPIE